MALKMHCGNGQNSPKCVLFNQNLVKLFLKCQNTAKLGLRSKKSNQNMVFKTAKVHRCQHNCQPNDKPPLILRQEKDNTQ